MKCKVIGAAALCATVCSVATAETNTVRYESSIAAPSAITHQAQLISEATKATWAPTTFVMMSVAQPTTHQAQLVAASTQATWIAATYASSETTAIATLPLQHQAQLTGLMTRQEWEVSAPNLSN